jgi:hypothetical protein
VKNGGLISNPRRLHGCCLEPYPSSYFLIGALGLLIQFLPDLVAVAAIIKHRVS